MRQLTLVVHISLDGFVAGPTGSLDGFPGGDDSLEFVNRLTDDADAALFGRTSYKLLDDFWPQRKKHTDATKNEIDFSNWYNAAEKIVLSKTLQDDGLAKATIIAGKIPDEIMKLKQRPGKGIIIFGSPSVAQLLMRLNLVDSYWIFINEVIFGQGIPLFAGLAEKKKLKLTAAKQISNGEMALNYVLP